MSPRQLPLSSDQTLATRRADQDGSVYLLSGTLRGLGGYPDVEFRWATLTFSGALGDFEAYIQRPNPIVRSHEYVPGGGAAFPGISIPVRNLPFNDADSMLALIDDGNFAWENSEASLLVGYLKPGQTAEDLVAEDWTYLVSGGVMGPPSNVEMDGFTATLYMRGARREQSFKQPLMPGIEEARGLVSGYAGYPYFDRKHMGEPLPLVIGKPNTWYKVPSLQTGIRGFTVSGYTAGTTSGIKFQAITDGLSRMQDNTALGGNHKLRIRFRTPIYDVVSGSVSYDEEAQVYTLNLSSGLIGDIPRGSFVQEMVYGSSFPSQGYDWVIAGHRMTPSIVFGAEGRVGWLLADGTIRPADAATWPFQISTAVVETISGSSRVVSTLSMVVGPSGNAATVAAVPCFFDPNQTGQVTQQPSFESDLRADSKLNYPTGGTGTDNDKARDGNTDTGVSLPTSTVITLTLNSEASGDFADDDTTASALHVVAYGHVIFTDSAGSVTFATVDTGGAVRQEFRFPQVSPRDFNATIRCVGGSNGGGGVLFEAWWEHDLATTKASVRTADVVLNTSASGVVGELMQYADLVFRWPNIDGTGDYPPAGTILKWVSGSIFLQSEPTAFNDTETISGITTPIPYPTSVMPFIQSYFLGPGAEPGSNRTPGEGRIELINSGVYRTAHDHFIENDIRWNFVLQDRLRSWQELEQHLAIQSRAHMYYGPTGHEIVFKEGQDLVGSGVIQEFRLPGTPRCNTIRGSGPLIERMLTSEVINTSTARWNPDLIEGGQLRNVTNARNEESVALFGEKRDPNSDGGIYEFWAHSPWEGHPTFDAPSVVSGILQFYADQSAFARTRFRFDTAWVAHGLDRGSPVRVVYAVAPGIYRTVAGEVEEIAVDPINGDRFSIRARSLDVPTPGLPSLAWEDLFTQTTDVWTDYIASGETWKQKWSL